MAVVHYSILIMTDPVAMVNMLVVASDATHQHTGTYGKVYSTRAAWYRVEAKSIRNGS